MWGRKHLLCPCDQQQCDKSQDPFVPAPERDLSGLYPRCKRTPYSHDPFQILPSPQRHTVCTSEGCHQPATCRSPPTEGTHRPKAANHLGSGTETRVLFLEPQRPTSCCLVQCDLGRSLDLPCVTAAPRPLL